MARKKWSPTGLMVRLRPSTEFILSEQERVEGLRTSFGRPPAEFILSEQEQVEGLRTSSFDRLRTSFDRPPASLTILGPVEGSPGIPLLPEGKLLGRNAKTAATIRAFSREAG